MIDKMEGPFMEIWLKRMEASLMRTFPECSHRFFIKEEQMVNIARIMLIVNYSAKDEQDIHEVERLTIRHIVAIKRADRRRINQSRHEIDTSSLITIDIIDQDIIYLTRIVDIFRMEKDTIVYDGMKRTASEKDRLLYEKIKLRIPELTKSQFGHIIDLTNFLDLVQRSPNYEKKYLRFIYGIYHENVNDEIRYNLGLV